MPGLGLLMMFLTKNQKHKSFALNLLPKKTMKNSKNNLTKPVNITQKSQQNSKANNKNKKSKKLNKKNNDPSEYLYLI